MIPTGGFPRATGSAVAGSQNNTRAEGVAIPLRSGLAMNVGTSGPAPQGSAGELGEVGGTAVVGTGPGTSSFPHGLKNEAPTRITGIIFEQAMGYMRGGHRVSRTCWPAGEFLVYEPDKELGMRFAIKNSRGHYWMPSQTDIMGEDWAVLP